MARMLVSLSPAAVSLLTLRVLLLVRNINYWCEAVEQTQPAGLLTDLRPSPALGVPSAPAFSWIVPHLSDSFCSNSSSRNSYTNTNIEFAGQVQSAYQVQVFDALSVHAPPILDSGVVAGNASVDVQVFLEGAQNVTLAPGGLYLWRVKTWTQPWNAALGTRVAATQRPGVFGSAIASCESDWSQNATFVVELADGFSTDAQPIWTGDDAHFAFFFHRLSVNSSAQTTRNSGATGMEERGAVPLVAAIAFVTAVGDDRLLGAYRLFAEGKTYAIGPGRGDASIAQAGNLLYDTVDVTPAVQGDGSLTLGLQCYHSDPSSAGVLLELHLYYADGTSRVAAATGASWRALNADSIFNPAGAVEGQYNAPQENIDANAYPAGARALRHFSRSRSAADDAAFADAVVAVNSSLFARHGKVPSKPTPHLQVIEYIETVHQVEVSPGHWFFDFGTDLMGGMHVELPPAFAGHQLVLTLSEELASPNQKEILFPMRTGNQYLSLLTARLGSQSTNATSMFEHHEYKLFRYGELQVLDPLQAGTCGSVEEYSLLHLRCPADQIVATVAFASYGKPDGTCTSTGANSSLRINPACHAPLSQHTLETACLGKPSCVVFAANVVFGGDPCDFQTKKLTAEITCHEPPQASSTEYPRARASASSAPITWLSRDDAQPTLKAWQVQYPWSDTDSKFNSSISELNAVWALCQNTLKVTSLDTYTDSNTRERRPYEADGYITASSRLAMQREFAWVLHSNSFMLQTNTWPTEWLQFTPLLAQVEYHHTGRLGLANDFFELLRNNTQLNCLNETSGLVDFSSCFRFPAGVNGTTKDIIDWPQDSRDGYDMTPVTTVVNAFAAGSLRALAEVGRAAGRNNEADKLEDAANTIAASMQSVLLDQAGGVFVDALGSNHTALHATVFPLWLTPEIMDLGGVNASGTATKTLRFLREKGMACSVYTAFPFLMGLYNLEDDVGQLALALMTTCEGNNTWCGMLKQGATCTMEAWNTVEKPNLSWSHPWASAPATAITRGFFGITATSPGFETMHIQPQVGAESVTANLRLPTIRGFVEAALTFDAAQKAFELSLLLPANTVSTVCLPAVDEPNASFTINGMLPSIAPTRRGTSYLCVDGVGSSRVGNPVVLRVTPPAPQLDLHLATDNL